MRIEKAGIEGGGIELMQRTTMKEGRRDAGRAVDGRMVVVMMMMTPKLRQWSMMEMGRLVSHVVVLS